MRALITGVAGFAGSHLAEHLLAENTGPVAGTLFARTDTVAHLRARVDLHAVDLQEPEAVRHLLQQTRPDAIFHLAAQSAPTLSLRDPWATLERNIRLQLNLLQAASELCPQARILVVSSSEVYGRVQADDLPVDEATPLRPDTPYAVSKITQEMLALQYYLRQRLHTVIVRPFNHIGPRQRPGFVAADFAMQIARAEAGLQPPVIEVGNLDVWRDLSDVRDVVRAYRLAAEQGAPGETYNVGTERVCSIRALLDGLIALARVPIEVKVDAARVRPNDVPALVSDCGKFRRLTGWRPALPFEVTLRDTLDYWRGQVKEPVGLEAG